MSDEAREAASEAAMERKWAEWEALQPSRYLGHDRREGFELGWEFGEAHGYAAAVAAMEEYVRRWNERQSFWPALHREVIGGTLDAVMTLLRERGPAGRGQE